MSQRTSRNAIALATVLAVGGTFTAAHAVGTHQAATESSTAAASAAPASTATTSVTSAATATTAASTTMAASAAAASTLPAGRDRGHIETLSRESLLTAKVPAVAGVRGARLSDGVYERRGVNITLEALTEDLENSPMVTELPILDRRGRAIGTGLAATATVAKRDDVRLYLFVWDHKGKPLGAVELPGYLDEGAESSMGVTQADGEIVVEYLEYDTTGESEFGPLHDHRVVVTQGRGGFVLDEFRHELFDIISAAGGFTEGVRTGDVEREQANALPEASAALDEVYAGGLTLRDYMTASSGSQLEYCVDTGPVAGDPDTTLAWECLDHLMEPYEDITYTLTVERRAPFEWSVTAVGTELDIDDGDWAGADGTPEGEPVGD